MVDSDKTEKYVLALIAAGKINNAKELGAAYFEITEFFATFHLRKTADEKLTLQKKAA